jgi:hypothetical protein
VHKLKRTPTPFQVHDNIHNVLKAIFSGHKQIDIPGDPTADSVEVVLVFGNVESKTTTNPHRVGEVVAQNTHDSVQRPLLPGQLHREGLGVVRTCDVRHSKPVWSPHVGGQHAGCSCAMPAEQKGHEQSLVCVCECPAHDMPCSKAVDVKIRGKMIQHPRGAHDGFGCVGKMGCGVHGVHAA